MNCRYMYCESCNFKIGLVNEDGEAIYFVDEPSLFLEQYRCPECNHDCMIFGRWFRV